MSTSYLRQTTQNPNPIARFAHLRRVNKSVEVALKYLPPNSSLLDFGAGEGTFLHYLGKARLDVTLYGIEPYMQSRYSEVAFVNYFVDGLDVITAFEVCEHLTDCQLENFLSNAYCALKEGGHLIVSVPIMYGPVVLLKLANWFVLRHRWNYTLPQTVDSFLGRPIPRPEVRTSTHQGFDFRWLKNQVGSRFEIDRESFSPFPWLPWGMNSQVFIEARKVSSVGQLS